MVDQRGDEAGRGEQRVTLQIDDQVDRPNLADRFGAALGAVAAGFRGHDHRGAERLGRLTDAIVVRDDVDGRHAGDARRRFVAALDQRFRRPARSLEFDQRLAGIARRGEARRDQNDALHRAAGQSWMWSTPTGLPSSITNKVVMRCSSNRVKASSIRSSGPIVFGSALMNTEAGLSSPCSICRLRSPSVITPTRSPDSSVTPTTPSRLALISTTVSCMLVSWPTSGNWSPPCMTRLTG